MIKTSVIFFALAIGALLLGIYGVGGISFGVGRILLFVFLALSILTFSWDALEAGLARYRKRQHKV